MFGFRASGLGALLGQGAYGLALRWHNGCLIRELFKPKQTSREVGPQQLLGSKDYEPYRVVLKVGRLSTPAITAAIQTAIAVAMTVTIDINTLGIVADSNALVSATGGYCCLGFVKPAWDD